MGHLCSFSSMLLFVIKTRYYFFIKADVLLYIIFSKKCSELTTGSKKLKKYFQYFNTSMSLNPWFIDSLYCWIYNSYIWHKKLNKIIQEPDWTFVLFWNLKSLYFICSHLFSFVVPLPVFPWHSLSFVVTRCHSIYHSLSFVVTRCTTHCYSLYNSLSFIVPLAATQCTTRLYFYKRLPWKQIYFYWSIVLSSYLETFKNREIAFVISKFGNLSKLELTDFNENSSELPIGILVGADYHQFLTHKVIKNEGGPVTSSSILG